MRSVWGSALAPGNTPRWLRRAVDAAKGYMASGMGFSRSSLIQQLTSAYGNKFAEAQAEYAADQVGLK
ncbi:Ltp family lipoprotein [Gryllotalpicola reticulitermitis]|uniref:Ltp family lipoprotein n=1 Tax=Gryllotalpicola reticulitermitis TaxID=1184153 RepID=A0ABV8Q3P0_9MICO